MNLFRKMGSEQAHVLRGVVSGRFGYVRDGRARDSYVCVAHPWSHGAYRPRTFVQRALKALVQRGLLFVGTDGRVSSRRS